MLRKPLGVLVESDNELDHELDQDIEERLSAPAPTAAEEKTVTDKDKIIARLQRQVLQSASDLSDKEVTNNQLRRELDKSEARAYKLKLENDHLHGEYTRLAREANEEISRLVGELNQTQHRFNLERKRLNVEQRHTIESESRLYVMDQLVALLEEAYNRLYETAVKQETMLREIEAEKDDLLNQVAESEDTIEDLSNEVKSLQPKSAKHSVEKTRQFIREMQKKSHNADEIQVFAPKKTGPLSVAVTESKEDDADLESESVNGSASERDSDTEEATPVARDVTPRSVIGQFSFLKGKKHEAAVEIESPSHRR